jgi:IS5 family transposase
VTRALIAEPTPARAQSPLCPLEVEHPFRLVKLQFGYVKARYRGLVKNTARLMILPALSNLWMARRQVLAAQL